MAEMSVRASQPLVDLLGAVDGHEPGGLDVDVAVGDEALDELLVSSRPPCTSRVRARSTMRSNARHICPIEFMQWYTRPAPRRSWAAWWPSPPAPSAFSTGTRTSS
jgi:hypothetical protein